jgi:SAM-dependent methyltransferase
MAGELRYRTDLFKGTAEDYDRFRPPYPDALLDDLRARVPLGRDARVLDLACGTGQVACPLAAGVAEVVAVDQEPELIELGTGKAERLGLTNIRWITGAAEVVALDGTFDLVAIGNAFHRLDRDAVARRLVPHLRTDGCVALVWGGTPWDGDQAWQRAFHDTLERWRGALDVRDRVPAGWEEAMARDAHEQVLQRAGFTYEGLYEFPVVHRWSVESLTGLVYSTSFLNRAVLGDHAGEFGADLREHLLACRPDGVFEQDLTFAYELARVSSR